MSTVAVDSPATQFPQELTVEASRLADRISGISKRKWHVGEDESYVRLKLDGEDRAYIGRLAESLGGLRSNAEDRLAKEVQAALNRRRRHDAPRAEVRYEQGLFWFQARLIAHL